MLEIKDLNTKNNNTISINQEILIVEDDWISMEALTNHLSSVHFNTKQCRSGKEAIEYLEYNQPILVILDIMMSGIDGYTVCEKIREKYSLLDLSVIFITAMSRPEDLAQGFSMGCNDYLTKPFSKHELLARVKNQITISTSRMRMKNLKNFSNETWDLRKLDNIAKKLFRYIIEDSKISHAALFYNKSLIKNTFQKNEAIRLFEQWEKNTKIFRIDGAFIISEFMEANNFTAILKSNTDVDGTDKKYFVNLISQARIVFENFQRLIGDRCFLDDLNTILTFQKHIRFIKAQNKQTVLYEDKNEETLYLKSSLKTIEYVFSHFLIRINRYVLVNPDKVMWIEQKKDRKKKTNQYIVNVDGEKFNISKKIFNNLPRKLKKLLC